MNSALVHCGYTHSDGYRERIRETHDARPRRSGPRRQKHVTVRHSQSTVEEHDEREKKIARHGHGAQESTHNQPSSSSSSGAIRADSNVQGRQESNDSVCTSKT